jgi:predicted nuclease of predicted toxin-antitoxin system
VKLLVDQNVSRKLVPLIRDLYPGSMHASLLGLVQADDELVWQYAQSEDYCILTADSDFHELAISKGAPPKVIWLKNCGHPTSEAESLIRSQTIRINEFLEDPEHSVLILRA